LGNTSPNSFHHQRRRSQPVTDVAAMVLAAGSGSRLAPLTHELPKPLCPVGGRALLDLALQRLTGPGVQGIADAVVNVHHHAAAIVTHLEATLGSSVATPSSGGGGVSAVGAGGVWEMAGTIGGDGVGSQRPATALPADRRRVWVSHERDRALGTAGAIGKIRPWLDGRGVLVINADAWTTASLSHLLSGWDPTTARVLVVGHGFGPTAKVAGALVPWVDVAALRDTPAGLYETCWAEHHRSGTLDVVTCDAQFVDCGTPADYLAANLLATSGVSSVDPTATVRGVITRCVIWPGAVVEAGEELTDAVRTTSGRTVLVRPT